MIKNEEIISQENPFYLNNQKKLTQKLISLDKSPEQLRKNIVELHDFVDEMYKAAHGLNYNDCALLYFGYRDAFKSILFLMDK